MRSKPREALQIACGHRFAYHLFFYRKCVGMSKKPTYEELQQRLEELEKKVKKDRDLAHELKANQERLDSLFQMPMPTGEL